MFRLDRGYWLSACALFAVVAAAPCVAFPQDRAQPEPAQTAQPPAQSLLPADTQPPAQPPSQPPAQSAVPALPSPAAPALPAKPPTPEELGDSLGARRHYQAAIAAYAKAPNRSAAIWNKMGVAYQMMFNLKEATHCYEESLKLDHRNPVVLNNMGTVYDSLKDYKQAERMYRRALKDSPNSPLILKNLGTNLLAQHKYSKGWDAYRKAIALDPQIFADVNGPQAENPASDQQRGAMNYYMALGCARAGYTDCAIRYLRMALDEGFTTAKKLSTGSDFASLRNNPAFQQLLAEQKKKPGR
jgi:tetratricopeptide (TPR) repeat protein